MTEKIQQSRNCYKGKLAQKAGRVFVWITTGRHGRKNVKAQYVLPNFKVVNAHRNRLCGTETNLTLLCPNLTLQPSRSTF